MMKLMALGNIMMGDDGAAVHIISLLEEKLCEMGIEVIYGETDIGYCITRISEGDSLILVDAGPPGVSPGKVSLFYMDDRVEKLNGKSHHGISLLDILPLYFPGIPYVILTIEAEKVELCNGLSQALNSKISRISKVILELIMNLKLYGMNFYA